MLESIAINRRSNPNIEQPFSIGHLAECLLFYGKVNAVISRLELVEIIRKCGIDSLIRLLSSDALSLHINLDFFGSNRTPKTSRLNYAVYKVANQDIQVTAYRALYEVYRNSYKCNQYVDRLMPFLTQYNYDFDLIGGFLIDEKFTTKAFREIVKQTFPDYPIPLDLTFQLHRAERGNAPEEQGTDFTFVPETNFDIDAFEKDHLKYKKSAANIGVTFLMQAAAAIQDVDVSSQFKSELASEDLTAPLIQNAILNLDQYKPNNQEAITHFTQHIVTGCPSVLDAINSGKRSFDDFMRLYEQSQQFKEWLLKASDDSDHTIINEYMKANNAVTFTDGRLYKLLKFLVVSTPIALTPIVLQGQPDVVNNVANLLAGTAADTYTDFIAQRFNHWKPNQFVGGNLGDFLDV